MKAIGGIAIGLVIGLLIGGVVGAYVLPLHSFNHNNTNTGNANTISPETAGNKAIAFISENIPPGVNATLINVTEEGNIYKITVNLSSMGMYRVVDTYMTKDGKLFFPQGINIEKAKKIRTIGDFIISGDELCRDEVTGKPAIYFFGSDGCPHCKWEHPVITEVASKFEGYISFHDNMNNLTADRDIFSKYNPGGGVPTIVLGCRFYRIGSGENHGREQEEKILTALICNLTGNEPAEVCSASEIQDLIAKISENK